MFFSLNKTANTAYRITISKTYHAFNTMEVEEIKDINSLFGATGVKNVMHINAVKITQSQYGSKVLKNLFGINVFKRI